MTIVAEGVETEDKLRVLETLGCDLAQGSLFARPLPATEMTNLLATQAAGGTPQKIDAFVVTPTIVTSAPGLRMSFAALPNRAVFVDLAREALERTGGQAMCMVLVVDVTRFRQVNERYGHATGDEVLTAIAGLLKGLAGSGAIVVSLGADEFAVLMPGPHANRDAVSLARGIGTELGPPVSMGIAFAEPAGDAAALLGAAERAKTGATECVAPFFAATQEAQLVPALQLEHELQAAIDGGQLCLYHQPIIDVQSGQMTGLTARVRWQHPVYGLLAPGHFLAVAEAGELASNLGAEIIALACRDLANWTHSLPGFSLPAVHIKVSARQLSEPGFVEVILREFERSGLDPSLLAVEVGSVAPAEVDAVPRTLQRLAEAGITAVLDNFGTDSAPLASLKDVLVGGLKIGGVFVDGLPDSNADVRITEALITIGRSLELPVVAKCVETRAQLATVRDLGCDRVQGFLFARPAPADVTLALLRQAVNWSETLHAAGSQALPPRRVESDARGTRSAHDEARLSLGRAAQILGVSQATVRRWTDSGKLRSTRTTGGHRRFAPADLQCIAASRPPAELRVGVPPTQALPALARLVDEHGDRLAALSWANLYGNVPGYFVDPSWEAPRSAWLRVVASTAVTGDYERLAEATKTLMADADAQGASVLECQAALERFAEAVAQLLAREGSPGPTITQTRRLFAFLRRNQLSLLG